jgi:hypothetical protein
MSENKDFSIASLLDTNRVGLKLTTIVETGDVDNVFTTSLSTFGNLARGNKNNYSASILATTLGNNRQPAGSRRPTRPRRRVRRVQPGAGATT